MTMEMLEGTYYSRHRERKMAYQREYYKKNKEHYREWRRCEYAKERDRIMEYARKQRDQYAQGRENRWRKWSKEEDAVILSGKFSTAEIADLLSRTKNSILQRKYKLQRSMQFTLQCTS